MADLEPYLAGLLAREAEATALGLGAVPVGAFDDEVVARTVGARPGEAALYILAIGER